MSPSSLHPQTQTECPDLKEIAFHSTIWPDLNLFCSLHSHFREICRREKGGADGTASHLTLVY